MTNPATPSHLRLVSASEPPSVPPPAPDHVRRCIAHENRDAGMNRQLSPTDPRWVLAARAYAQLDGVMLTPERRQRLVHTAKHLGLRPFDANLIIAIVQDKARHRQELTEAEPALRMITPAAQPSRSAWTRWLGAAALALIANLILIWWLLGGT